MKTKLLFFVFLFIATVAVSQNGFNYKALISKDDKAMGNRNVTMRFTILQNGNNAVYTETHNATTDKNGIVSVNIGEGTPASGTFNNIDWSTGTYFLKVEIDAGDGYKDFGTAGLQYVPFAKYAEKAGNTFSGNFHDLNNIPDGLSDGDDVDDADHDPANELQSLSVNGTQLTISNGNTVTLPTGSGGDQWGSQVVQSDNSLQGDGTASNPLGVNPNASIFNDWDKNAADDFSGNFHDLNNIPDGLSDGDDVDDADHDPANELQTLSINGTQLTISNGNTVNLPSGGSGAQALDDLSDAKTSQNSIFLGTGAGQNDYGNTYNTAVGIFALKSNTAGIKNTAVGFGALGSNTTGYFNTATGYKTLDANTTGYENTATGWGVLAENTTGNYNTGTGVWSLHANTTGNTNTAYGAYALQSNTTGNSNVAIGLGALYANMDRSNLVAIGDSALFYNGINATESYHATGNTAIGGKALANNTSGYENTASGQYALYTNTTGSGNTAIGKNALKANTSGYSNTAVGVNSLLQNTFGHTNTAMGVYSLQANISGINNSAFGYRALYNNTEGEKNTAMGFRSMYNTTTGHRNVAVGSYALENNTTGHHNTAVGHYAFHDPQDFENSTAIGYNTPVTGSNQVRLGNANVTSIGGYANWTTLSGNMRFNTMVRDNVPGLDLVMRLRPVTYHLDMEAIARYNRTPLELRSQASERQKAAETQIGFIAQEVARAADELGFDFHAVDKPDKPGDPYGLRFAEFVPVLVKAIQEQQQLIQQQQRTINKLQQTVKKLQKQTGNNSNNTRDIN